MFNPFLLLYQLFNKNKKTFFFLLIVLFGLLSFLGTRLSLKEDISSFIPKDERTKKYQEALKRLKVNDRIVVNIFLNDSTQADPDALTAMADLLVDSIQTKFDSSWVRELNYKVDDELSAEVFDLLYQDLPFYLNDKDYRKIEAQLSDSAISAKLKSNYETILSPEGTVLKNYLIKDPLGLNNYALKKLMPLQADENIELYNGYYLTKDRKNLLIYLSVAYPANDASKNSLFVNGLTETITTLSSDEKDKIKIECFGGPTIAVANVKQIKIDSLYTTSIALVLIFAGLLFYFRNFKIVLLIFVPVVFGAAFAMGLVYLIRDEVSAIAIGAGSIVIGIALDYSLHYFTHLRHERSVFKVISDLTLPLTLGCTTTIGAFFCLHFMQSEALQDMGLFAGFALLGAALACLVILPQLTKFYERTTVKEEKAELITNAAAYPFHKSKILLLVILVLTIVFGLNYTKVGFETDMTKLSYITPEMHQAEDNLDRITNYKLKSIYLLSEGKSMNEALEMNNRVIPIVDSLTSTNRVQRYANIGEIVQSDSIRQVKLEKWKQFWTEARVKEVSEKLYKYGEENKFKAAAFDNTIRLFTKTYNASSDSTTTVLTNLFLKEYIHQSADGAISIMTIVKVKEENKAFIYEAFENIKDIFVMDRGSMASMFAKILSADFNLILLLCSTLVFGFLLLSYGRVELALLAFLPMVVSWIWILGIMGLFGIKFNIVNIIICTFVFGLGDDYSIFTVDGLEQKYKYGKDVVSTYRNSILLSAYTTIVGIGVLIFAKHPALYSIALITVIGISCILVVSLIVQPYLYEKFVLNPKERGRLPITFYTILFSAILFCYLLLTSISLGFLGLILKKEKVGKISQSFVETIVRYVLFVESKFGDTYAFNFCKPIVGTKLFNQTAYFEVAYAKGRLAIADTDYYVGMLRQNYILKGPVLEWYTRIKIKLEDNYKVFDALVPKKGKIVDVGCGYGYLSYMLSMTATEREITGIDYDEEKIEIARHGVLRKPSLNFHAANVLDFAYEKSDAFIISDVLHYLKEEDQAILIKRCLDNLASGGLLIIRDGNSEYEARHKGTKLTELFSTKIIGFNKVTSDGLFFTSKEKIMAIVSNYDVSVEILDTTQFTSNIIFIIRKNN